MPEFQRLNLRLNLDNPLHREAWEVLSSFPTGHRTDAVCHAILERREQENLKNMLREVLREERKTVAIREKTTQENTAEETGDDDDAVLGFLRTLQGGDEP